MKSTKKRLWELQWDIDNIREKMAHKEEMIVRFCKYVNGVYVGEYKDFSTVEAIRAILKHLNLELKRTPEKVTIVKKAGK